MRLPVTLLERGHRVSKTAFTLLAGCVLAFSCGGREVVYGTEAYRKSPPEVREAARRRYLAAQEERAARLEAACRRLGTVQGAIVARQYAAWAAWAIRAEDDPVAAEHVLTLWAKEYALARRQRRRLPRTVEELEAWLRSRQNAIIGSWAHPEAPLWLAIGETAEALRLLGDGDTVQVREPLIFLAIVRDPAAAAEVTATTFQMASAAGLEAPMRNLAWLPWVRWVVRSEFPWDSSWEISYRRSCAELLLDASSGGYQSVRGRGMDIVTTFRLATGWSRGQEPPTWVPSPQAMAATLVAMADTLSMELRAPAASLLVGSLADLDSIGRANACASLAAWAADAEDRAELAVGSTLVQVCDLLYRLGVGNEEASRWLTGFGCTLPLRLQPSLLASRLRAPPDAPTLVDLEARELAARLDRAAVE